MTRRALAARWPQLPGNGVGCGRSPAGRAGSGRGRGGPVLVRRGTRAGPRRAAQSVMTADGGQLPADHGHARGEYQPWRRDDQVVASHVPPEGRAVSPAIRPARSGSGVQAAWRACGDPSPATGRHAMPGREIRDGPAGSRKHLPAAAASIWPPHTTRTAAISARYHRHEGPARTPGRSGQTGTAGIIAMRMTTRRSTDCATPVGSPRDHVACQVSDDHFGPRGKGDDQCLLSAVSSPG